MKSRTHWLGPTSRKKDTSYIPADTPEEWLVANADDMVFCEQLKATIHKKHCQHEVPHNSNEYVTRRVLIHCSKCLQPLDKALIL